MSKLKAHQLAHFPGKNFPTTCSQETTSSSENNENICCSSQSVAYTSKATFSHQEIDMLKT